MTPRILSSSRYLDGFRELSAMQNREIRENLGKRTKTRTSTHNKNREDRKKMDFTLLPSSVFFAALSYLFPSDVLAFERSSKALRKSCVNQVQTIWKLLCLQRWNLSPTTMEKLSGHDFKDIYRSYLLKFQLPFGKFTSFQVTFGFGKTQRMLAWLLLEHRSNGLLMQYGRNLYSAELRICLQNISNRTLSLNLERTDAVRIWTVNCDELADGTLPYLSIKVLSKNGVLSNSNEKYLELRPYEFSVFGIRVVCPPSMNNEPDMLSAIERLEVLYSDQFQTSSLIIHRDSEDKIWSNYDALPRGLFLLKSKST